MTDQIQTQQEIERAWLDLTYGITRAPSRSCICDLSAGVRWSGYLGSAFIEPARPRRRFLFVGANHNPNGLAETPAIKDYNGKLRYWADHDRKDDDDTTLVCYLMEVVRPRLTRMSSTSWSTNLSGRSTSSRRAKGFAG
jgi:hypothetical protein